MISRSSRVVLLRYLIAPFFVLPFIMRSPWPEDSIVEFTMEVLGYLLLVGGLSLRLWSMLYPGFPKYGERFLYNDMSFGPVNTGLSQPQTRK